MAAMLGRRPSAVEMDLRYNELLMQVELVMIEQTGRLRCTTGSFYHSVRLANWRVTRLPACCRWNP
jgi:hypothetical protein